jgi:hypothetical protein
MNTGDYTMQMIDMTKACASTRNKLDALCSVPCPGHGTTCNCPPLIVLAVLSAEQAMQAMATAPGRLL